MPFKVQSHLFKAQNHLVTLVVVVVVVCLVIENLATGNIKYTVCFATLDKCVSTAFKEEQWHSV